MRRSGTAEAAVYADDVRSPASDEVVRLALDAAAMFTWESDLRARTIRWSPNTPRVLGCAPDELPGSLEDSQFFVAPDDRARLGGLFAAVLESGAADYLWEFRGLEGPAGPRRWEARGRVVRDHDGNPVRVLGVTQEVTDRHRAESRYRQIFEASPLPTWIYDVRTLRFLAVNAAATAAYGWTPQEFLGMTIADLHPAERVPGLLEVVGRPDQPPSRTGRWRHCRRDGTLIDVETASHAIDYDGRPARLVVVQDVTARLAVEAALVASEARFRTIANAAPALLWAGDADGGITYVNERWTEFSGAPGDRLLGDGWLQYVHPEDAARVASQWQRCCGTGEPYEGEARYRDRTGAWRWHLYRALPRRGADGAIVEWHGWSVDVHDAREAAARLGESDAMLRLALEATGTGLWRWEIGTDCLDWSPEAFAVHGVRPADFTGRSVAFFDCVHPDDRERVRACISSAVENGVLYETQFRILRPDGEVRWVQDRGAVRRDADGRPAVLIGTITDVTDRLQAEEALRRSETLLQAIIDGAPAPVYAKDEQGRYFLVNRAWSELTGVPAEHARALTDEAIFGPAAAATLRANDAFAREADRPVILEETTTFDDRTQTWLSSKFPLRDAAGRPYAVCGVSIDITDRKLAEQRLQEADRRKDHFLATLSHELRNPLAPIRTAAQVLAAPNVDERRAATARAVIQRQVGHMALLLDDLLDLARITQGKLSLKRARVRLTDVVDAAVEAALPLLDDRRHRLAVGLPAQPVWLDADPLRLSQVLANLLTNAAKYTDPGGNVALTARLAGGRLRLAVRDDGIGIAAASLPRLFEMFAQVDGAAARTEGGLGIGLALVKGLVTLHGGAVEVHSEGPGRGAEFVVQLPLPNDPGAAVAERPGDPRPAGTGRRVLVADDNRDAADSLAMLLELGGHEVRVAHDGRAALALANAFRPEVALLDIGMPEMDGHEVARALRTEPWGRGIVLVALTGWGQDEDRNRALAAGFDHHLTKPVDPDVIERLLA